MDLQKIIWRLFKGIVNQNKVIKLEMLKSLSNTRIRPITTKQLISRFYSTLTKSEMWDLYERYKLDFELFGYSPDEYFGYATEDESTPSYEP